MYKAFALSAEQKMEELLPILVATSEMVRWLATNFLARLAGDPKRTPRRCVQFRQKEAEGWILALFQLLRNHVDLQLVVAIPDDERGKAIAK